MNNFEMICNPVNDENTDLIPPNDKNETTEISDKKTIFYLFEYKNISRIIIHIFVHISLLSLLEPLFYFLYVVKIEKDLFFNQLQILIKQTVKDLDNESINNIISNPYIYYSIINLYGNDSSVDDYFSELKNEYEDSITENNSKRKTLEIKAYYFSAISLLCSIIYFGIHQIIYKEKYLFFKIILEHIILVLFIGFYEYWFFNNIVLHYSPWTSEEITYYLITCMWNKASIQLPILNNFAHNETSCDLDN